MWCGNFRWEEDFGELWNEAGPFDVVLAADCVYDPALAPPFAAVVDQAVEKGRRRRPGERGAQPGDVAHCRRGAARGGLIFEDLACVQVPRLVPARAWAGNAAALAAGALRRRAGRRV